MNRYVAIGAALLFLVPGVLYALFCLECGYENPDRAKYCMECGTAVASGEIQANDQAQASQEIQSNNESRPGRLPERPFLPEGSGAIVLYFVKNWPDRGDVPGFLNVYLIAGEKKENIARLERSNYWKTGMLTTYRKEEKTVLPVHEDIARAGYFLVKELPEGEYTISVEKRFRINQFGMKAVRHKRFERVTVTSGSYSLLSYYWEENNDFGEEHLLPRWFVEDRGKMEEFFCGPKTAPDLSPETILD